MYRGITLIVLILVVLAALYLPVSIPYELVSIGSIQPSEEWRLVQDASGSLYASHQNYKSGMVQRLSSWQFERGDLSGMEVVVHPDTFGQIICGDTIVRMYSSMIQQQILGLENMLNVKRSETNVLTTGEKNPIVEEALSKLVFAKEAFALREKEYEIAKKLVADGVIAKLEFTRAETALQLARINVRTEEKALEVANTGTKPQTLDLNLTEIGNLQKQIHFLRERNAGYVIVAPFDGVIAPVRMPGEVLILHKNSEYIVTIPVKTEEMPYIKDDVKISVKDPANNKVYTATLINRDLQTQVLGGRSVAFVRASIHPEKRGDTVTLGTSAQCTVHCDELNQREYLKRLLHFSISAK